MKDKIKYRVVSEEYYSPVLELLQNHFYRDDPMSAALKPQLNDFSDDEEFYLSNLKSDPPQSIVAIFGDRIVGALVTAIKGPNIHESIIDYAEKVSHQQRKAQILLLAAMEKDSNVFKRYNVDKAIHGHALVVHSDFRGLGIGMKLFENGMERAKILGFPVFTADCSSIYSARLAERLEMDCINICSMSNFRMSNSDEQFFFPKDEDDLIKTYAKKLL